MADRPESRLRPEIQLLRALAVLAVVGNHLAPGLVHGGYLGVDVFFVISGYLISAHLLRELDASGRVRLGRFWARRARRLLPASLLVLLVSVLATVAVVPATMWALVMRQVTACALYVQNWALAHDALDYFASSSSPSPVTHYWSLSVEEQFYLVWPLLAFGAYAVGRRLGRPRAAVLAVFAVVVAASLAYSVWYTDRLPHAAYFVTPTRMWELGVGGLLAFVPTLRHRLRHLVAAAAWATLLVCVARYDESFAIPGWLALFPVLATAAVILAGDAFVKAPPRAVTPAIAAGVWVGGISYSLYLWHWPLIVVTPYATGRPLGPAAKLAILGATLLLAHLSARYVEDPVRRWPVLARGRLWRTLVPAAVAMAVVVGTAQLFVGQVDQRLRDVQAEMRAAASEDCFGAGAIANDCRDAHVLRFDDAPLVTVANQEPEPGWGRYCQQDPTGSEVVSCEFGVPLPDALHRVALVGDSHAGHWYAALQVLAREHRWNVVMMTKSSCTVNGEPRLRAAWDATATESCHAWVSDVVPRVADDASIDAVITSGIGRRYVVPGVARGRQVARQVAGYHDVWSQWTDAGKQVVVLGDVPQMRNGDIPTCVAEHAHQVDPCTTSTRIALAPDPLLVAARSASDDGVVPIDLTRYFCGPRRCHSVIGGIVAFGDGNHMIGLFSQSLAPYLDEQLTAGCRRSTSGAGPAPPGLC